MAGARRWVREALPRGGLLSEETWDRRHRAIVALLVVHAIVIGVVVALRDFSLPHAVFEGSIVGIAALLAAMPRFSRRTRAILGSFGMLSASAILVHLSGGYIEMHFHFFVMIIVISLYQDWWPFLLSVGYVIVHHGLMGTLDPASVYNHPAAIAQPWLWASIHGVFILGASAASVVAWRLNEDLVRRQLSIEQRARKTAEAGIRAREEFLSIATHELRTPVTSIKGYAQLAMRAADATDLARVRQTLRTLDGQADRLARLITQLLDVSRIEAGRLELELERTDLGLLLLRLIDTARQHSTIHAWRIDVPTEVHVNIDAGRIEQVISNLLDNAMRYSPDGGTISVALRPEGRSVRIAVADEGLGIPAERLPRVFERFYQAHSDRNYGGMGLGLYITREIVERHGGRISAESKPGSGAVFAVTLPVSATAAAAAQASAKAAAPRPRAAAPNVAAHIWIVEDDDDIRALVSSLLRDEGYDVSAFRRGQLALEALDRGTPDLILLDKLMPEMSGTEFAEALRERPGELPRVLAMCAARDAAEWAASIGAVGYVSKPFDIDALLHEISLHVSAPAPATAS